MTRDEGVRVDCFLPPQMADRMVTLGTKKVALDAWTTFALAILAGAFIAIGAELYTLVVTGSPVSYTHLRAHET